MRSQFSENVESALQTGDADAKVSAASAAPAASFRRVATPGEASFRLLDFISVFLFEISVVQLLSGLPG